MWCSDVTIRRVSTTESVSRPPTIQVICTGADGSEATITFSLAPNLPSRVQEYRLKANDTVVSTTP